MTDEKAAALFEALGEVEFRVEGRSTFTSIIIKKLDLQLAINLRQHYRGSVSHRTRNGQSNFIIRGRDSELFAELILPHVVDQKKRDLLEFYLSLRVNVINASGRGKTSQLDDEGLELRRQIEQEVARMQGRSV